nr:retrovirus-related Pol polyprotein from transposon TNT 1-94 [Tanacetum cinerariifolium]
MATVNDVPQLVNKKGGMEPYYLKCIKDGPFQPKTIEAKETWTDLVYSFKGPSDTKENRIMDLKLECQTFRAKSTESLSQTYTLYKTLLNEISNDGVNLFKHKINDGFVNSLPEKWPTFSQGLRNANHTQTLDLANIYEMFVYEDNLIQGRYPDTKKTLITIPSGLAISTAFFSNNVIQDFQENPDDEEEVSEDEEVTQVKVLIALADDELTVGKSHARNVPKSQAVNESLKTLNTLESSKDSRAEFVTPLPPLKNLLGASSSSKIMPLTFQSHSSKERPGLGHIIHIRRGVLAESSQSNESSIGVMCNTCGSTIHSTSNHNEFDYFKRGEKAQAAKAREPTKKWETYHVTFYESKEAIMFINTLVDEIEIDDSSRYPPDEFLHADDPSRQYHVDFTISYYVIPHGQSLTEVTQENYVSEVIVPNEHDVPLNEDIEDPPDTINIEGTLEQNVQDDQRITQPTDVPSGNNTEASRPITEPLFPYVPQSHIPNQASTSSHPAHQDRWLRDQHIEHVNIIGNPGEGMLTSA